MKSNINRIGEAFDRQNKKTVYANASTVLELGTINANLSLSVSRFANPIPKDEYMVSLDLTHENYFTYNELNSSTKKPHHHEGGMHSQFSGDGYHTHDDGLHDHRVPSVFRPLQPGDRVLVAWVGDDAVVICVVVPSNTITKNE